MNDADLDQFAGQFIDNWQGSHELIHIKDSCGVKVQSTDTKLAASLQVALQAAIAIVVSISIADADRAKAVTQELLQKIQVKQQNYQKTVILRSANVSISTADTDVSLNIQALLQILLALVVRIDIL